MTKIRITPVLLWDGQHHVLSRGFGNYQKIGNLMEFVNRLKVWDVDEIVILNIATYRNARDKVYLLNKFSELIRSISKNFFSPLIAGGGISSVETARNIIQSGADRVLINSVAHDKLQVISDTAEVFGSQAIIAGIDTKKNGDSWTVYSCGGLKAHHSSPINWARQLQSAGAGEILVHAIDRDGMAVGFDLELIRTVNEAVQLPLMALGGAKTYKDLNSAIQAGASAAAAGNMFAFSELSYPKVKSYFSENINIRHCNIFDFQATKFKSDQETSEILKDKALWGMLDDKGLME